MQKEKLNGDYINDVFPFGSEIFIITDGTDLNKIPKTIYRKILEDVEKFMKTCFWMDNS